MKAMDLDFYLSWNSQVSAWTSWARVSIRSQGTHFNFGPFGHGMVRAGESVRIQSATFRTLSDRSQIRVGNSVYTKCLRSHAGLPAPAENRHGRCRAAHQKPDATSLLRSAGEMGSLAKTPADSAGPLVVLQSRDSTLLVQKLAESGIVASNRYDGLRISFHVYNTMDDVNALWRF